MAEKLTLKQLKFKCAETAHLILDISHKAGTGHVGSALSISDLLTVLYNTRLNNAKSGWDGKNILRDRFILSKGHAGAALYAVLFQNKTLSKAEIMSFGADESGLCEHPEVFTQGVEMTSGSLGHGLAYAAGIAVGLKKMLREAGGSHQQKVPASRKIHNSSMMIPDANPHVFVLISDGECGEGSVWEAAMFASRMKLDNLTVILDDNGWQCFGKTRDITGLKPAAAKWKSFGWETENIDGHNLHQIRSAYQKRNKPGKPKIIIAKTVSGNGIPAIENQLSGHYKVFTDLEYTGAKMSLNKYYKTV
jgi:transketolase